MVIRAYEQIYTIDAVVYAPLAINESVPYACTSFRRYYLKRSSSWLSMPKATNTGTFFVSNVFMSNPTLLSAMLCRRGPLTLHVKPNCTTFLTLIYSYVVY